MNSPQNPPSILLLLPDKVRVPTNGILPSPRLQIVHDIIRSAKSIAPIQLTTPELLRIALPIRHHLSGFRGSYLFGNGDVLHVDLGFCSAVPRYGSYGLRSFDNRSWVVVVMTMRIGVMSVSIVRVNVVGMVNL